jgi:ATP-dependent DNA ligase
MAHDEKDVQVLYAECRRRSVEGVMVKLPGHLYQRKRTHDWYKLKPEETHDGRITGVIEAVCGKDQPELGLSVGDKLGRTGSVTVQLEDGSIAAPHGIPHTLGRAMHENPEKYIGRWCEFSCMEVDRQGGYRHPVFKRLREDKA